MLHWAQLRMMEADHHFFVVMVHGGQRHCLVFKVIQDLFQALGVQQFLQVFLLQRCRCMDLVVVAELVTLVIFTAATQVVMVGRGVERGLRSQSLLIRPCRGIILVLPGLEVCGVVQAQPALVRQEVGVSLLRFQRHTP